MGILSIVFVGTKMALRQALLHCSFHMPETKTVLGMRPHSVVRLQLSRIFVGMDVAGVQTILLLQSCEPSLKSACLSAFFDGSRRVEQQVGDRYTDSILFDDDSEKLEVLLIRRI